MNYSSKKYLGDRPYANYDEYLDYLNTYLLISLRCFIRRSFRNMENQEEQGQRQPSRYRDILSQLNRILQQKDIDEDQELSDWLDLVLGRKEVSESMGKVYPIDKIIDKFGLGEFGLIVLSLALFGTLDRTYQRIFRFINGDDQHRHPTLELAAKLYYQDNFSQTKMLSLIYEWDSGLQLLFPQLPFSDNLFFCELVCDERLIDMLLGKERYLTKGVSIEDYDPDPLLYREEELKRILNFRNEEEIPVFLICGRKGAGKKHLIRHFSNQFGRSTVFLNLDSNVINDNTELNSILLQIRYAARECVMKDLPLAVTGLELLKDNDTEKLYGFLENSIKKEVHHIFLCMETEQSVKTRQGIYIIELKDFTELQRYEIWKFYTREYILEENLDLNQLANTFIITPGQILGAIRQASLQSGGKNQPIQLKLLYQACYSQLDHKLSEKTSKVNADFAWEDLKMPSSDKRILRDICNCVKNRHIVMNEWNFSKIIPYGAGLTVLFAGPPGTGKTMAAQVIANELRMELYKIDVSQIFDKYVGETEKNIKQIFEQAKRSNSILFFDEADAIFNKRIEASSSNDRFANIESSLLLQCVEEYSGISILATNNFNSIDSAFIRRFKYYILFREPDEAVRYEIWKSVLPKEAPVSPDVDLKLLAKQFEFTGAVIKNVVISSAYLAAEKREPISLIDILVSIKREMFKNNLILTKEKLGSLGYLYEDIN